VNVHVIGVASGVTPSAARTPEVSFAVYVFASSSGALGDIVSVFVAVSYEYATGTCVPSGRQSEYVVDVNDDACIAWENVALTWFVLMVAPAPVAPLAGVVELTLGPEAAAAVVNDHVTALASGVDAGAADLIVVSSFAVYDVLAARVPDAVSVATFDVAL
jgi:hypothetical protein